MLNLILRLHLAAATIVVIAHPEETTTTTTTSRFVHTTTTTHISSANNNNNSQRRMNDNIYQYDDERRSQQHRQTYELSERRTIATIFDAPSGSFGNMFDTRSFQQLTIVSLDFYTDLSDPVSYEVYTLPGRSYLSAKDSLDGGWRHVANGTVVGAGPGKGTTIPAETFEEVTMEEGELRGWYVTLTSPDIRYTWGEAVGETYASNGDLEIMEGSGVANYPLGKRFFAPRVWNGALHYHVHTTHTPTTTPTLATLPPTPSPTGTEEPTDVPIIATTVKFPFTVQHPITDGISDVVGKVKEAVETRMKALFSSEAGLVRLVREHHLEMANVVTVPYDMDEERQSCVPRDGNICTTIQNTVAVTHDILITAEMVRDALLKQWPSLLDVLDFPDKLYVGANAVSTGMLFSLPVDNVSLMGDDSKLFFEFTIMTFLNNDFHGSDSTMEITTVTVDSQVPHGQSDDDAADDTAATSDASTRRRRRRRRRELSEGVLDIHATITGEYMPPPEVNMDTVVQESLGSQMGSFMETLNNNPDFEFKVTSPPLVTLSKEVSAAEAIAGEEVEEEKEAFTDTTLFIGCVIGGTIFVVVGFFVSVVIIKVHKKHEQSRRDSALASVTDWEKNFADF